MHFALALLATAACLIPLYVGIGIAINGLVKVCPQTNFCADHQICKDYMCIDACLDVNSCGELKKCYASNHSASCVCYDEYLLDDKSGNCKLKCQNDSNCKSYEKCKLGLCINACTDYHCKLEETSVPFNHKCSCECLPKSTRGFDGQCKPIRICSNNKDCYQSEYCHKDKKCYNVCFKKTCPPNEGCFANNHESTCRCLPGFDRDAKDECKPIHNPNELILNLIN